MDWDRFITLNCVKPLGDLRNGPLRQGSRTENARASLPVLMYHSISETDEPVSSYYKVCTSPRRFAEQMRWLSESGWKGVSLQEGLAGLRAQESERDESATVCGARKVAITFDDGFRDFHTAAVPVLQEWGFSATMFLPTAFIGKGGNVRQFKGRDCLSWAEVREHHAAGFEFGSHTVNHPKLVDLSPEALRTELRDSKKEIEDHLQSPVSSFAYPYAFPQANRPFVSRILSFLREERYSECVTTEIGRVFADDDSLRLRRLPVSEGDDIPLFSAKLQGAYDWLAQVQGKLKFLKQAFVRA